MPPKDWPLLFLNFCAKIFYNLIYLTFIERLIFHSSIIFQHNFCCCFRVVFWKQNLLPLGGTTWLKNESECLLLSVVVLHKWLDSEGIYLILSNFLLWMFESFVYKIIDIKLTFIKCHVEYKNINQDLVWWEGSIQIFYRNLIYLVQVSFIFCVNPLCV